MFAGIGPARRLEGGTGSALLAATLLLLVCACTSPSSTGPVSTPAGASAPPPPVSSASPGLGPPSESLPSGAPPSAPSQAHADAELESMLPDDIGGIVLTKYSVTPDEFVGAANRDSFATFLATVDRPREGVTLAVAADPSGSIVGQVRALKVAGAQSADLLSALLADKAYVEAVVSSSNLGGKDVTVLAVQVGGSAFVDFVYVVGDVALIVTGADAETAARFLEVLP